MKILHVVPSIAARHGGVSESIRQLAQGLTRLGVEVHIWTTPRGYDPKQDGPSDETLKRTGVHIQYFPIHAWRWLGTRYAYSPNLAQALRKNVKAFDGVHIHAMWLYTTWIASRACRRARIPYVVSPCGALDPYGLRSHRIFKQLYGLWVERKTLAGAATVHFTSTLEQRTAQLFGASVSSIVIPRSIQTESFPEPLAGTFRKQYPEIGNRTILLFLGRLHPKKGLLLVAEAFTLVARQSADVHLVIVGPDDGAEFQVRDVLGKAGLMDRTTFTGLLTGSNKWAAFYDSYLFLLPSEDENFGVAVLEAMATGTPVLVSNQVGLADAVDRAHAGMVLDRNAETWAAAIDQLLANLEKARAMGQAGRKLAQTEYAEERIASTMKATYAKLKQKA